jgi:hypothetical protein
MSLLLELVVLLLHLRVIVGDRGCSIEFVIVILTVLLLDWHLLRGTMVIPKTPLLRMRIGLEMRVVRRVLRLVLIGR